MIPQGLPQTAKKKISKAGEFEFDGLQDFIFCSNDVNEEHKYEER